MAGSEVGADISNAALISESDSDKLLNSPAASGKHLERKSVHSHRSPEAFTEESDNVLIRIRHCASMFLHF